MRAPGGGPSEVVLQVRVTQTEGPSLKRLFPMSANAVRLAWERLKKRADIRTCDFTTFGLRRLVGFSSWAYRSRK